MDRKVKQDIQDLLAANRHLDDALTETVLAWPKLDKCWVDIINEPTFELEDHKLTKIKNIKS